MKRTDRWMVLAGAAISVAAPVVCLGASFVVETRGVTEGLVGENEGAIAPATNSAIWLEDGSYLFPFVIGGDGNNRPFTRIVLPDFSTITAELPEFQTISMDYLDCLRLVRDGEGIQLLASSRYGLGGTAQFSWHEGVIEYVQTFPDGMNVRDGLFRFEDGTVHLIDRWEYVESSGWPGFAFSLSTLDPAGSGVYGYWRGAGLSMPVLSAMGPVACSSRSVAAYTGSRKFQVGTLVDGEFVLSRSDEYMKPGPQSGEFLPLATAIRPDGSIDGLVFWQDEDIGKMWLFHESEPKVWTPEELVFHLPKTGIELRGDAEVTGAAYFGAGEPGESEHIVIGFFESQPKDNPQSHFIHLSRLQSAATWDASSLMISGRVGIGSIYDGYRRGNRAFETTFSPGEGILDILAIGATEDQSGLFHFRALNTFGSDWESVPGACLAVFLGHLELQPAGLAPYDKDDNGFVDAADYVARHH